MEIKKRRLRRKRRENSMKLVTEDLITDIISRVPVEDLMRFTRVSGTWRSLICTDPYFHRLQIERTHRPFLIHCEMESESFYNYWIRSDSIDDPSMNLEEIYNPFDDDDAKVVGFYHGLFAFQKDSNYILNVAVSNPTTKKHVIVPPPNIRNVGNVHFCGFGYDRAHDCYKLVAIVLHYDHNRTFELMVYDLNKGGKWRSLQFGTWWKSQYEALEDSGGGNYCALDDYKAECVDGVLYWCIYTKAYWPFTSRPWKPREMRMMVCFVLADEEFHVMKPPDLGEVKYNPNIAVLDGRLCLVCQGLDKRNEFWSVQLDGDDGGKRQWRWTKLFAMSDPNAMLPRHIENVFLMPVCFSAFRSKIPIRVKNELFWYDIGKKKFYELANHPIYSSCYSNVRSCV